MSDKTCNGWSNYATWRINLEMLDDFYLDRNLTDDDAYDLSQELQNYVDDIISEDGTLEGLAIDYARAFVGQVNYYEIAEHLIADQQREAASA